MADENKNIIIPDPIPIQEIKAVESAIGNLSVRSIIALLLVNALILYPFFHIDSPVQITNLAVAVVAFYFGKNQK